MSAMIQAQCAARVAPVITVSGARKSAFSGKAVASKSVSLAVPRAAKLVVRAADAAPAKAEKEEEKPWSPPKLNPNTPSPIFGGSTGGLLRKAQVRRVSGTHPTRQIKSREDTASRDVFPAIAIECDPRRRATRREASFADRGDAFFSSSTTRTRRSASIGSEFACGHSLSPPDRSSGISR